MATLRDIKLRIKSVKSTQKITKAMKMVSASKMKRAEDRIRQARPYSDKLREMVSNLSDGLDETSHPLLAKRKEGKAIVLVISSDRGLCGGLNSNLLKRVEAFARRKAKEIDQVEVITLGKKGFEFFKKSEFQPTDSIKGLRDAETEAALVSTMERLIDGYANGEYNQLWLAYNHFKNVISQIPTVDQVLPMQPPEAKPLAAAPHGVEKHAEEKEQVEFLLEPSKEEILDVILPQYVENQAFTALLDNQACEHASRMTAMDSASKNAGELISSLTLKYNRARQAAITTELTEIISGAESL